MANELDARELERDGREAFAKGWPATECPYTFNHTPCWVNKDYNRFEREYRPKMDAWMKGWIAAKKEALKA